MNNTRALLMLGLGACLIIAVAFVVPPMEPLVNVGEEIDYDREDAVWTLVVVVPAIIGGAGLIVVGLAILRKNRDVVEDGN